MRALIYVLLHSAKNGVLEMFRKPVKLLPYLFMVGMLVFVMLLPTHAPDAGFTGMVWLKGIFAALLTVFGALAVQNGLGSGASLFEMSDVNLLFVSPVNPRKILMYGVARLVKVAFLSGFFILFQRNTLSNLGVDSGGVLILLGVFMLAMASLSVLSIVIYSVCNGRPRRKAAVRVIAVTCVAPFAVYTAAQYFAAGDAAAALERALASPFFAWIPVIGWGAEGAAALIQGHIASGAAFLGLIVAAAALLILYLALSKSDYYEDVLAATETAYEKKRAMQTGDINAATSQSRRSIRVRGTGVGGLGATAIFRKHVRESFRENRFGFLGTVSVLTIAGAAIMAYLIPDEAGCIVILQTLMWMQIFLIGTGRGMKELYLHYIYMIPERSLSKIVWSNMEPVLKTLIESVLIFGIAGVIIGDAVHVIVLAAAAYTLFSMLLIAINCLSLRWTGADISAGVLVFLYVMAVIIIILPGAAGALVAGIVIGGPWGMSLGLAILAAWEFAAALACFALAKGSLDKCDMPVMKTAR